MPRSRRLPLHMRPPLWPQINAAFDRRGRESLAARRLPLARIVGAKDSRPPAFSRLCAADRLHCVANRRPSPAHHRGLCYGSPQLVEAVVVGWWMRVAGSRSRPFGNHSRDAAAPSSSGSPDSSSSVATPSEVLPCAVLLRFTGSSSINQCYKKRRKKKKTEQVGKKQKKLVFSKK